MMWTLENRDIGAYKTPGHPIRFSKSPAAASSGAPSLGEHSDALLAEAGHTPEQIAALRQSGVVR